MQGKINQIWRNERNGNPYWVLSIDGERYTVWDQKYLKGVQVGSMVLYEFKQSGKYRNISSLNLAQSQRDPDVYGAQSRDVRIARLSCLRSATELLSGLDLDYQDKVRVVLDVASQFEEYVFQGGSGNGGEPGGSSPSPSSSPGTADKRT